MKAILLSCALIGLTPALAWAGHGSARGGHHGSDSHLHLASHRDHRSSGLSVSVRIGSRDSSISTRFHHRTHRGPIISHGHHRHRHVFAHRPVVVHQPPVVIYQQPVVVYPAPRYHYQPGPPLRTHRPSGLRYSHPRDRYHYHQRR